MIKIVVGMFLAAFDYVISPDGKTRIDLLPDFIGYAIIAYGFYKIYKNYYMETNGVSKNHDGSRSISVKAGKKVAAKTKKPKDKAKEAYGKKLEEKVRQGFGTAVVTGILTYIAYLLDMYGVLANMSYITVGAVSLMSDLARLLIMYLYIQILSALQGENNNFQIERMMFLWKMTILCIACEYISYSVEIAAMTFLVFEKILLIIFMCYMLTSSITYKDKFLKKSSNKKDNAKKK